MASLPSFYLSAPTSPRGHSPENLQFFSTRSSPGNPFEPGLFSFGPGVDKSNNHEFEFETSQRWADGLPARSNSFSAMAFADELFCDGQVLPLKLPPRLQSSVPTSPRSFGSRVRNPFGQSTWNDDFDPFMIALEKVSEETSERKSVHRRSRSYSPFRARSISQGLNWAHEKPRETRPEANTTEMADRKGLMYSKWVRSQTMVKKRTDWSMHQGPTARTMIKRLWLGKRVSNADFSHDQPMKPIKQSESSDSIESKMKKVKSVLLKFASLKKETETKQISKISYLKRLSLSFKTNQRKKESLEPKLAIVKHKTKLPRCLGYNPTSPTMKRTLGIS